MSPGLTLDDWTSIYSHDSGDFTDVILTATHMSRKNQTISVVSYLQWLVLCFAQQNKIRKKYK